MGHEVNAGNHFETTTTLHTVAARRLQQVEMVTMIGCLAAIVMHRGLRAVEMPLSWEFGVPIFLGMLFLVFSLFLRRSWSRTKQTFVRENRFRFVLAVVWMAGVLFTVMFGPFVDETRSIDVIHLTELCFVLRALVGGAHMVRELTATSNGNPALMLVATFVVLIVLGTTLLMLPRAYADPSSLSQPFADRLQIALFTATSASCVTGLVVVDTAAYWSHMGHVVILVLFQIGGLGIMTCGAFFAIISGRQMRFTERAALHEVLESSAPGEVRRLLLGILLFTVTAEMIGAVCLFGMWPGKPFSEKLFLSVFHSVSAFCNAGFSLTPNSFVGMAGMWQIWGVVSLLIIVGGLGFATLYNIAIVIKSRITSASQTPLFNISARRARLSISAELVLVTSAILLVAGTIGYFVLETTIPQESISVTETGLATESSNAGNNRLANAWFQSVTFRTAGFNSVDHGKLAPATKLWAIFLMFVGAAPGSTGGGIKVTAIALAALRLISILQGRQRVELRHRTIPEDLLNRALTIISLGAAVIMITTILLVAFENDETQFLNHLFEATSAFCTVGVSAIGTSTLTTPSQLVLTVAMFLGRVGPLTLLIGLAGTVRSQNYDYPQERVSLG